MIEQLVVVGLSNAVVATVLALIVVAITSVWRQAPLAHLLWLIVLVKLVTPPLVDLPITIPVANQSVTAGSGDLGETQFGSKTEAVLTFDPSGRVKNVESASPTEMNRSSTPAQRISDLCNGSSNLGSLVACCLALRSTRSHCYGTGETLSVSSASSSHRRRTVGTTKRSSQGCPTSWCAERSGCSHDEGAYCSAGSCYREQACLGTPGILVVIVE